MSRLGVLQSRRDLVPVHHDRTERGESPQSLEIGGRPGSGHESRRWSVLGEYYDGPSPYGQFFRDNVVYYGLGLHIGL